MLSKINHRIIVAVMLHFVCDKASSEQAKVVWLLQKNTDQHNSYQNIDFIPVPSLKHWEPIAVYCTYSGQPKLVSSS